MGIRARQYATRCSLKAAHHSAWELRRPTPPATQEPGTLPGSHFTPRLVSEPAVLRAILMRP